MAAVQLRGARTGEQCSLACSALRDTGYVQSCIEGKHRRRRCRIVERRQLPSAQVSQGRELSREERIDGRIVRSDSDPVEKEEEKPSGQEPSAYSAGRRSTVTCTWT